MEETTLEQAVPFEELLRNNRDYQSAFDRKVDKALQTARANWEREREEESLRLRERAAAEAGAEYAGRHAALEQRERELEVATQLLELGLPTAFAPWLTGTDAGESRERVARFEGAFRGAVAESVAQRMAGFAPQEPAQEPVYDRQTLRGMTPREINAHWAEIQHTLKGEL